MKNKLTFLLMLIATFLIGITTVNAESGFTITDLDLEDKSETIFVDNSSYNGLTVNTNVTFYELQDYVVYKVKLTNNTEYDYIINGISDDNEDSHVTIEYNLENNQSTIKAGEYGILNVKMTFSNDLSRNERLSQDQLYYLNALNIKLDAQKRVEVDDNVLTNNNSSNDNTDVSEEVKEEQTITNPKTGDLIFRYILLFVICSGGLIVIIKYRKRMGICLFVFGVSAIGLNYYNVRALEVKYVDDDIIIRFEGSTINIVSPQAKWTTFTNETINRDNIQSMKFVSWDERPTTYTGSFDISENQNEAVIEYYVLDENTNLYDIYITSPFGYTRYYNDDMRIYIGNDEDSLDRTKGLFSYIPNMVSIDFEYLDMYNITNTSYLFDMTDYSSGTWACHSSLKSITWGKRFNTVNITDMSHMFAGLDKLESIDLEKFDVKNVKYMQGMFARDEKLETIDVSTWDTSNVISLGWMFYQTKSLKNLDVSKWDTSNVTDMRQVFYYSGIETVDVSKWDTSKVTTMMTMFCYSSIKELDVSRWDTSNVTDMSYMFSYMKIQELDLSNWNTSSVENMSMMFHNDSLLKNLNVKNWDTSNVTTMYYMFYNLGAETLDLSDWDTSNVDNMYCMFFKSKLKKIDFRHLDLSNASNVSCMFFQASNLQNIYVETAPTYKTGANKADMWWQAGINSFTVWDYENNGNPLEQ